MRAGTAETDQIDRLRCALAERDREMAELRRQLAEQAKEIAELRRQLAMRQQNSTTSKPPSSDGLAGEQRVRGRRRKYGPPRGGQPGHPGDSPEFVRPTACTG